MHMSDRDAEVKDLKIKLEKLMLEKSSMVNVGKTVENVSARQKRRKLSVCHSVAEAALWFAETFGLVIDKLVSHTIESGKEVVVNFRDTESSASAPAPCPAGSAFCAMQVLYLLDRFGVSDEFYHELTQLCPSLPRSYRVKDIRKKLNDDVDVVALPSEDGSYRPLKPALASILQHELSQSADQTTDKPIVVKLSGDGARFSSSSTFLLLSFSFPGTSSEVLSGRGNHTFAALRAKEDYSNISSLIPVLEEINELLEDPHLHNVGGREVVFKVLLGGDLKFLLMIMGLNEARSTYACVWCTVSKDKRWDMDVEEDVYCKDKARTLASLKHLCKFGKRHCSQHLGCVRPPLVNIEPADIVLDELHLLLRIGDVLLRNIILTAASMDIREKERHGVNGNANIIALEQAVRSCGVSFQVWLKKDHNGKPVPGNYDWTALTGKHKPQVLQKLPDIMPTFLPAAVCDGVVPLWEGFCKLYKVLSSWKPTQTEVNAFQDQAKTWVRSFLDLSTIMDGHQRKNVTPYMHCLVYHVPSMLKTWGNIKQFSGQGVEKNNDDSKRHYFSSNKHDAPMELIRSEVRLEEMSQEKDGHPSCQRVKRTYKKANEAYWSGGGIQEDRRQKRQRRE